MTERRSTLRWADTLTEATAVVLRRPARTLLTALGTILGVGAFVATTGIAETARAQVSSRFDALKATEVRVQDARPDGINPFPSETDRLLEQLNGVNRAGYSYDVHDPGSFQPRSTATRPVQTEQPIRIVAATPGAIYAALPTVGAGRIYNNFHNARAERVAVVGRVAAEQLGVVRLENQPAIFIQDTAYTVIGIVDDVQRNPDLLLSIIIPAATERQRIGSAVTSYEVLIDTEPGAAALVGRQAPLALRPDDADRLRAVIPPDPRTLRNSVESDITTLYYALASLALLIGTIAIANATLLNTIERRSEIGLRRALGAKRHHIIRQITLEAAITGAVAAVCGTTVAIYAIAIVAHQQGWTPTIDATTTFSAPFIGLVTGAIAGVFPALKAARTPPAITLRS